MLRYLSEERCVYYLDKLRVPINEEVAEIEAMIDDEVTCITLWDNRIMIYQGVLKEVNEHYVYITGVSMTFKGKNNGILSVIHKGYELYSVL